MLKNCGIMLIKVIIVILLLTIIWIVFTVLRSPPGCSYFNNLIKKDGVEKDLIAWCSKAFPGYKMNKYSDHLTLSTGLFLYVYNNTEIKSMLPGYLKGASVQLIIQDEDQITAVFFGYQSRSGLVLIIDESAIHQLGLHQSLKAFKGNLSVYCVE
jgi:hypothetical protein